MAETIGIIGLGRMGMEAAKKYIAEGYKVVGYARRPEVIKEFTAAGGIAVKNSREVAEKSGKVIVYVLNDQQVIERDRRSRRHPSRGATRIRRSSACPRSTRTTWRCWPKMRGKEGRVSWIAP